jgi:hypothetical protein
MTVALAIATVVGVSALSAFAMFNRHRLRVERLSVADETAKVVTAYLQREARRIGGSVLRPWQAIAVTQDPCRPECGATCTGLPGVAGDQVTFAFLDEEKANPSCTIRTITSDGSGGGTIKFDKVGGVCCPLARAGSTTPFAAADLNDEHIMLQLTSSEPGDEKFKAVTYAHQFTSNTTACIYNYIESAQTLPLASVPRPPSSVFDGDERRVIVLQGSAVPIKVATAYVGCAQPDCVTHPENRGLFVFSDGDAGASITLSVNPAVDGNALVSPNVADLQVALGYDNDDDGEVSLTINGLADDYAGNASPTDPCTNPTDLGTGVNPSSSTVAPDPRLLRTVLVGVMSAMKMNDPTYRSKAFLPGGNQLSVTGIHLRALHTKAAFRSLNLLD